MSDEMRADRSDQQQPAAAGNSEFAPEPPSGIGAIAGPFFNAILAPTEAFKAIDARPALSWGIIAWIAVISTVLAVINLPITQQVMVASARASIQASGREIPPEQLRQMSEQMVTFGTIAAYASSIFVILLIGVTALILWVMASVMGGRGSTFGRAFGVAAVAAVVRPLIHSVYASIILNMNPPVIRRPEDAATMAPTLGLDLLLKGGDTPPWLAVIYQRVDLFLLWWAVLIVMGSMTVLKLSKGQGITAAAVLWVLGTLVAVGGALLQGLAAG
jgi:hypothetical protein